MRFAVVWQASVPWFPQEWADEFYVLKGVVGLVATLILIAHMHETWGQVTTLGRRLRYYALLAASILLTGASVEQVNQHVEVNLRNIGGLVVATFILVAALVSLREDHRHR